MLDVISGRNMKAVIICDHCKGSIVTLYPAERNPNLSELDQRAEKEARPYKGLNRNEHWHPQCKKAIERAYDKYIMQRDMFQAPYPPSNQQQ